MCAERAPESARSLRHPVADEVRIGGDSCGVCYGDEHVLEATWPGIEYPRVPGNEVAGRINAVGGDVAEWDEGDCVGVCWHSSNCFTCDACRRGEFFACENSQVTGTDYDGVTEVSVVRLRKDSD